MERYQNLVVDFITMNNELLLRTTNININQKIFFDFLHFVSVDCLMTSHPSTIKAASRFLSTLYKLYWRKEEVEAYEEDSDNEA